MELAGKADELAVCSEDCRVTPRCDLDEDARILLIQEDVSIRCRMVDLCLNGCRVRTQDRLVALAGQRVEAAFRVRGFNFQFSGVIQWADGWRQAGIRFVDVPRRRRDDLAEALGELTEESAARAARQAKEEVAPRENVIPIRAVSMPDEAAQRPHAAQSALESAEIAVGSDASGAPEAVAALAKPAGSDRRAQSRHAVDAAAVVILLNVASRMPGRLLDLSLSGCRIRTDERFPVGIYTRIEVEFRLEGLPFRLAGVVQAIHDRHQVGIRLLDVSPRKRGQLEELIGEIRERRERQGTGNRE